MIGVILLETVKVFESGNSQAVRLPREYRFSCTEVGIIKVGEAVLLYPTNKAYETFVEGLNGFSNDFMSDGRTPQLPQEREKL